MRKGCEPAVWGMAVPQCSFTSLLCVEFGFLHHPGAVWGHSLKVQSCDSACLNVWVKSVPCQTLVQAVVL